ncbi:hypothetical protein ACFV2U_30255 [Streptomyces sp. NPDC059697]|uniref:hypothetical protein n=1 Tax=Streptomyces sp. NPDC059697 TaxID=3346912 RepID=UPI00369B4B6E
MIGVLVAGFLITHGLLHPDIWAAPAPAGKIPFDPGRSWALTAAHVSAAVAVSMTSTPALLSLSRATVSVAPVASSMREIRGVGTRSRAGR